MNFMLYVFTFIVLEVANGRYLLVEVNNDTGPGEITDVSKISGLFRNRNGCWTCIHRQCQRFDPTQLQRFVSECSTYREEDKFKGNGELVNCGLVVCKRAVHEIDETCVNGEPLGGGPTKGPCNDNP